MRKSTQSPGGTQEGDVGGSATLRSRGGPGLEGLARKSASSGRRSDWSPCGYLNPPRGPLARKAFVSLWKTS